MVYVFIALSAVLSVSAAILAWRLASLKRAVRDIASQVTEKLGSDTNTPVFVRTGGRPEKELAAVLSGGLQALHAERTRLKNGDAELKAALTNAAHDIRTPLTAIRGYLDLIAETDDPEKVRSYISVISEQTSAIESLTQELFAYSLASDTTAELACVPTGLVAAVEESVIGFYGLLSARGIEPQISLPEQEVVRELDPDALNRVLGNIIGNAVKYSGGDLFIGLSESGDITFRNSAPELDMVSVSRLFNRFYTVENARRSTGLGLYIAKTLTKRMGGDIRAEYSGGMLEITVSFPGL